MKEIEDKANLKTQDLKNFTKAKININFLGKYGE
jgi:hypothetical protein